MSGVVLIAVIAIAGLSQLPLMPRDLGECRLSHSFVVGETPAHPGAIEIWDCRPGTVVTLTQFLGPANNRQRKLRAYFEAEVASGEKIVGCKNESWYYEGYVAVTSSPRSASPEISRAWKADLDKWRFEDTDTAYVFCNRDFGLE